jgi:hypothetical protein
MILSIFLEGREKNVIENIVGTGEGSEGYIILASGEKYFENNLVIYIFSSFIYLRI